MSSETAQTEPGQSTEGRVVPYRYSLLYASRGANVVVNDFNAEAAQKVVDEIRKGVHEHACRQDCLSP